MAQENAPTVDPAPRQQAERINVIAKKVAYNQFGGPVVSKSIGTLQIQAPDAEWVGMLGALALPAQADDSVLETASIATASSSEPIVFIGTSFIRLCDGGVSAG